MEDPFSALKKTLQRVFYFEVIRKGEYTYRAVQRLKEAIDNYNPDAQKTFSKLLKAIKDSMPHIEKWHINFDSLRKAMDELAKRQEMSIDWTKVVAHPKVSSRFQFRALNNSTNEVDLLTQIASKAGKPYTQLQPSEVTKLLLDNREQQGFSQKLSSYLKKHPDFLFQLILDSERNFTKICNSRLILYLTDQQIAKAIIKHLPKLIHEETDPFKQVDQLVNTINKILSKGRSVSTLLRNAEAKPILYNNIFFQIYLSDSYKAREEQPPQLDSYPEDELLKPDF